MHLYSIVDGYRCSHSDTVTGQAAWFDLKVAIEKCTDEVEETAPQLEVSRSDLQHSGLSEPLQFGKSFERKITGKPVDEIHEHVAHDELLKDD